MNRGATIVTGATGYLGSHFVLRLLAAPDARIFALVRSTLRYEASARFAAALRTARRSLGEHGVEAGTVCVLEGDVRDERCGVRDDTLEALRGDGVDAVWHFAADLRYEVAHGAQIRRTNVEGSRQALALARAVGARRFFYVSTAYTAGIAEGEIPETLHDRDGPFNNAYEETKCEAEHVLTEECRALDMPLWIVRPSIVIGPHSTKRSDGTTAGLYGLMRAVLGLRSISAPASGPVRVPATGDAEVNLIPVDVLTRDLLSLRDGGDDAHGIYHLTASGAVTVAECLEVIASVTGLRNIVLRPPGSFQPNSLERRIARRVEFYLGYLHAEKTFAHRLPSRWEIDRDELMRYVVTAYEALETQPRA